MSTTISSEALNNEGLSSFMLGGAGGHRRIVSLWRGRSCNRRSTLSKPISHELNRSKSGFQCLAVTADNKARRPRSRGIDHRGGIPEMFSIEERPAQVADRAVPGHWEGDLILGARHQSALGALVEHTTRTVLLVRLKRQDAETVRKAFARKLRTMPKQMKPTLAYNQGKEMSTHRLFT